MTLKKIFYKEIEPYQHTLFKVSSLHHIYIEQAGNPDGLPILFVHGGPGAGCSPSDRRFFDPKFYRIIIVDQRGAGRSHPFGEMKENTTQNLIEDFEKIRKNLNIKRWLIFGGSWGSTLSLAYAQKYPTACLGLILRGVWLGRTKDIEHFFKTIGKFYPEREDEFYNFIPKEERDDLLLAYYQRLMDPNPRIHMPAAQSFTKYEVGSSYHTPLTDFREILSQDKFVLGLARTEAHYFVNHFFLKEGEILEKLNKIRSIPCKIIHGRYDAICPFQGAYELSKKWPEAELQIIDNGGHSSLDLAITKALITACDAFKKTDFSRAVQVS